jgi:hypothetical protein
MPGCLRRSQDRVIAFTGNAEDALERLGELLIDLSLIRARSAAAKERRRSRARVRNGHTE